MVDSKHSCLEGCYRQCVPGLPFSGSVFVAAQTLGSWLYLPCRLHKAKKRAQQGSGGSKRKASTLPKNIQPRPHRCRAPVLDVEEISLRLAIDTRRDQRGRLLQLAGSTSNSQEVGTWKQ